MVFEDSNQFLISMKQLHNTYAKCDFASYCTALLLHENTENFISKLNF